MAAAAMLENRKKLRYLDKRLPLKPRQHGALRILYCILLYCNSMWRFYRFAKFGWSHHHFIIIIILFAQ